jgi:hypothetical protein
MIKATSFTYRNPIGAINTNVEHLNNKALSRFYIFFVSSAAPVSALSPNSCAVLFLSVTPDLYPQTGRPTVLKPQGP